MALTTKDGYVAEKREKAVMWEKPVEAIFAKLDEPIEDVKNGRVVSSDELWEELFKNQK